MKYVIVILSLFLVRPLFAQDKWEYVDIVINSKLGSPSVQVSKSDTGIYRELFFDTVYNKPRKFNAVKDIFNAMGQRGFELILAGPRPGFAGDDYIYTFKRRIKSENP
jgi:hypothetical protein